MRTALYCGRCLGYLRETGPDLGAAYYEDDAEVIRWILCDRCRAQLEGRHLSPLVGAQPAVCLQCREPFEATRQAQKFCSSACRARAWRAQRAATSAT